MAKRRSRRKRRIHPRMKAQASCTKREWKKRGRKGMPVAARRRLFGQIAKDCARETA